MNGWNLAQNQNVYWTHTWGQPYFSINENGHVVVKPHSDGQEGDLFELVKSLVQRGIEAPILIRFDDIIRDRIRYLQAAFDSAIEEFNYQNSYRIAYPIKVNPQCHVVELIEQAGRPNHLGLEVGSKPELISVLTFNNNLEALLLCNGYKDAEYIELALLARKLGRRSIIIIEQPYELPLVLDIAKRLNVEAELGFRMKLSTKGSGRWKTSGGDLAKFGLNTHEIVLCLEQLQQAQKTSWLKLLHFHIGSQITSIESIKKALNEAARMYTELAQVCPSLSFFDAGGGLGVDYDGSKTTSDSSMNYSVEEYARDVVSAIGEACQKAELPHPTIITESGRALVAHHAVLITEVIDVAPMLNPHESIPTPPTDHEILANLYQLYHNLSPEGCQEALHDANELKEAMLESFMHGNVNLMERAYAEKIYRHLIAKIHFLAKELPYVPEDIENLDQILFDTYFCNFSVFQSLPDSWAIEQLFPIMPIHRLKEEPKRRAILADLSCDSDGKIDRFVSRRGPKHYIPLHEFKNEPYYVGIFLTGAYQEILGGLHNLFGDANAVHVGLDSEGQWEVKHVVEGDSIEEVLRYVQYNPEQLIKQLRNLIEKALRAGRLSNEESAKLQKRFKESLESYTYLIV
ncbi:biosynthetic arginine decarboxylase [Candidatus Protochlamydia phocaeensis]|uniref:biosynthetic arginine decarboxylase n=1 Tax=Candidatus Protochlamydia phocaeensis TaxID=1414722 RepID=UPI000837C542|nr:biosynthetic arginine decarboxylase [Candidatus Protochlamydia phocaeensis]